LACDADGSRNRSLRDRDLPAPTQRSDNETRLDHENIVVRLALKRKRRREFISAAATNGIEPRQRLSSSARREMPTTGRL
jgi:hypothetical protein